MLRIIKWVIIIVICGFLVSVAVVNREVVSFRLPLTGYEINLPLYLFLLLSILTGVVMGGIISLKCRIRAFFSGIRAKKNIAGLQKELSECNRNPVINDVRTIEK